MKRLITVISVVLFYLSCTEKDTHTISYTVSPFTDDNKEVYLKINTSFTPDINGETFLRYQDKAWGQDSLHNVIKSIKLVSEKGEITSNRDSGWFHIKHPKGLDRIEVEYTIKQDTEGDLTTWDTYRPIIEKEYFHVFSHSLFMLPKNVLEVSEDHFDVRIKWIDFPKNYTIANSFGAKAHIQHIENTSEEEFHTAVFVGGDFRVHDMSIKNKKVALIIRGDWEVFNDSTIVNVLKKTVSTQRDFWQDHSQEYFAVTMIPTILERGSGFQGSGLTNSFATNATNNTYLEVEGLVYLFNHELQHNWTGSIIKNDNEEKQYWFSEGFTDYYTLKNIAKGNIYNLDKSYFIKEINSFIKALYTNPAREMPNSEMNYDNFWSGKEGIQKLPYRRGALLAFYLDHKIQQETNGQKSLDNVLLEFKNDALVSDQRITHPYFIKTVNKYVKKDFKPFFDKHIEQGKLYDLETIFDDFGFEYEDTSKVFDLGFDFTEDKGEIASIDKRSEAYNAGLRKGDVFKSRSYYYNSIKHEAEFTVIRDGKSISVKYFPVKASNIPQLKDNNHNHSLLAF